MLAYYQIGPDEQIDEKYWSQYTKTEQMNLNNGVCFVSASMFWWHVHRNADTSFGRLNTNIYDPFYKHGLILIPVWIGDHRKIIYLNYLPIPKCQRLYRWVLGMGAAFHAMLLKCLLLLIHAEIKVNLCESNELLEPYIWNIIAWIIILQITLHG